MEDSKLYSNQDIEKLKQKIEAYRSTLTSLKMGTSMGDYLFMKKDFDGIKTQIAHLEGLTETIDDKQSSQIKGYEEQIKFLSMQIESLNQTIEETNQEILMVLNKLLTIEDAEAPTTTPNTENTSNFMGNSAQRHPRIEPTTNKSVTTSKQPSYKMLQNLAGKATNMQLDIHNGIPSDRNENQRNKPEERHFNQQYFQSVNTHPSQIYNGLYRNTTTESTFHFKNATNAQEIPISVYEPHTLPPAEIHNSTVIDLNAENPANYGEPNNTVTIDEMNSVLTNEPAYFEASETVNEPVIPEASEVVNEPVIPEASEVVNEPVIPETPEVVNEPVFLEAPEMVNEPVIPEAPEVVNEPVFLEASKVVNAQVDMNKSSSDEIEIFEARAEEEHETQVQIEEVNKQPELKEESPEESQKKDKGSLFFNFFRKWS
ncbi:hypothetical protein FJQ98_24485 [Lysinibacillus agricola]|uniref:Uncharacterized protein n=1 Tax=Lysinibacillus agricola TaxID=2590012 RepID=A0ABX7AQY6_9BACI|nr:MULTISPECIES: hypothetical protein [Lysinibacillus]KOS63216.1 hypothetical protein AN161_08325 [Lysinibacillus sp. FJAT-14222]QQP12216.1 hypothetical protein FJQ98_24485 [Lysinibacillus agricola]